MGASMGVIGLALAFGLSACATPKELKRPVGHPVMAPAASPDPVPAYVSPEPESVADEP